MSDRGRGRWIFGVGLALVAVLVAAVAWAAMPDAEESERRPLLVQSTTSVRDSGLLREVVLPEFRRAFPQYKLKLVAVGTGQAIENARAGQGDVLIAHSPRLEEQFVADGFSREPVGRTVMWNDFVVVGTAGDPAGVRSKAPHDAIGAFEAIAAAGASGRATFVSRGDESGTNVKELALWEETDLRRDADSEPVVAKGGRPWYRRAGLGMADALRLVQQCPFPGGGCYTITDRGTFAQLMDNGAVSGLEVVMERQSARAPGGPSLMVNAYRAYAINPARFPDVNAEGAQAFLGFLTGSRFQERLASFPSRERPGFFAAARPGVSDLRVPVRAAPGRIATVHGRLQPPVPGQAALEGVLVELGVSGGRVLGRGRTERDGRFRLRGRLERSSPLVLRIPRVRDLSPAELPVGRVAVADERGEVLEQEP